jgi:hypothetical protein
LVNLLIAITNKDSDKIRAICLDLAILSKDSTAEEQASAVIGVFGELSQIPKDWRDTTIDLFPGRADLLKSIPDPSSIDPTKMLRIQVMHDTYNTARKMGDLVCNSIIDITKDKGITDVNQLVVLQGDCHNRMQCVGFKQVETAMGVELDEYLREDLKLIPNNLRISCHLSDATIHCDKVYYEKGHGNEFGDYKKWYHPDKRSLPVISVVGGNRQDASFEGAFPIYGMLDDMIQLTHHCLLCGEN